MKTYEEFKTALKGAKTAYEACDVWNEFEYSRAFDEALNFRANMLSDILKEGCTKVPEDIQWYLNHRVEVIKTWGVYKGFVIYQVRCDRYSKLMCDSVEYFGED